jgi:hypothetical protein
MVSVKFPSLLCFEGLREDRCALRPVFRNEESRRGIGRRRWAASVEELRSGGLSWKFGTVGSSLMGVSARIGSDLTDELLKLLDFAPSPLAPERFFSVSPARRRSLELMYISPL